MSATDSTSPMTTPAAATGARLLRGERNWWFLGPGGGLARLRPGQLAEDGTLRPGTERSLREHGLLTAPAPHSYALTVLTSTHCNLGCGYCFQNTGQDSVGGTRPPRIARKRLTSRTITEILDFTDRQMAAADLAKLRILLFGGEPCSTRAAAWSSSNGPPTTASPPPG